MAFATSLALAWLAASALPGSSAVVEATNPWTLQISPSTLTVDVPANVSLTVTDGSELIGCIVIDVPAGFTVTSASVANVPAGFVWSASVTGSGPTLVTFSTTHNEWRLNSQAQGVFVVRVVATSGPLPAWTVSAYKGLSVASTQLDGGPLVAPSPFHISSATPAPTPTRAPTPRPTAIPAVTPTPAPHATGAPGAGATPTAGNGSSSPDAPTSASPASSSSQSPSPSPADEPSDAGEVVAVGGSTSGGSSGLGVVGVGEETTLDIGALPDGGTVQLDAQAVGGVGMYAWVVPGLFLTLPGLLLIVIVAVQAGFATGFIPVTRRVLGFGLRRRRRQSERAAIASLPTIR